MKKLLVLILIAGFGNLMLTAQSVKVKIETTHGTMIAELSDKTPKHRDNFVKLVESGFYENLLFHRVIENFMIQGGDPDSKDAPPRKALGMGGPGYTLPAEIVPELFHQYGAIAAARLGDQQNPRRESSGSQFYIVQGQKLTGEQLNFMENQRREEFTKEQRTVYKTKGGTPHLDGQYTVFGQIIEGFDVINNIAKAKTDPQNRPISDIKIIKMTIVK